MKLKDIKEYCSKISQKSGITKIALEYDYDNSTFLIRFYRNNNNFYYNIEQSYLEKEITDEEIENLSEWLNTDEA